MKPSDLVKVKALEWEEDEYEDTGIQYQAYHIAHDFIVWRTKEVWHAAISHDMDEHRVTLMEHTFPTEADAKAACQAHYEAMIYELLEVR